MKLSILFILFTIGISIMVSCNAKSLTGPDALTAADAEAAPQFGIFGRMATSIFSALKMALMRMAQVASKQSIKKFGQEAAKAAVKQTKDIAEGAVMDEIKNRLVKYDNQDLERRRQEQERLQQQ